MYSENQQFDWETQRDAETLIRAKQIKANPERLQKAQTCIAVDLQDKMSALEGKPSIPSKRFNKATVKQLDQFGRY